MLLKEGDVFGGNWGTYLFDRYTPKRMYYRGYDPSTGELGSSIAYVTKDHCEYRFTSGQWTLKKNIKPVLRRI